jgi:DNA polymerase-3 subunit beta
MQITIERNALLKALAHVTGVVERRSTIPILSNVLLRAEGADLTLTATDLDIEVVERVPAMVSSPGGTTIQALILHDIVRKLPDGSQLELSRSGDTGQMSIRSGKARFALQALAPDDFPSVEASDLSHAFEIEAKDLKRLIEKSQFAISTEETRFYLNGIYLHAADSDDSATLRAVATDGHRLALVDMPRPDAAAGMPGVIVPRKTVLELRKLCEAAPGKMKIELSESKIRFSTDNLVLTSKLIDASFPDYARVIPRDNDRSLKVGNGDFAAAVDRVSTLSIDKGRPVKLMVANGQVTLAVTNPDSGSAEEQIFAEYAGEPLEIGFNARYLLDICAQIEAPDMTFLMKDPGAPTLVRDDSDEQALYVLMPMRV